MDRPAVKGIKHMGDQKGGGSSQILVFQQLLQIGDAFLERPYLRPAFFAGPVFAPDYRLKSLMISINSRG
jgi:hypothetical protein